MQGSGSPLTGARTFAAQPARQIGIEEIGAEARRSAFSMGQDAAERSAASLQRIEEMLRSSNIFDVALNLHNLGNAANLAQAQFGGS